MFLVRMVQLPRKGYMSKESRNRLILSVSAIFASAAVIGSAAAAAPQAEWTTKDARAAVRAVGYPKPRPRTVTCRGMGTVGAGAVYGEFRCRTTYRRGHRVFYMFDDSTGWIVAGPHKTGARQLRKGFVATGELARIGGFAQSATNAATAYIQRHYNVFDPAGTGCTQAAPGRYVCAYTTPAVTVTVTYRHVSGGWTLTGTG